MSDYVYQGVEEPSIASIEQSHIAQSLAAELQNPAQPGERHSQIKRTILPMLELGLCDAAVFAQFRRMYGADFLDSEIEALIAWGRARLSKDSPRRAHRAPVKASEFTPEEKIQNAIDWLGGFRIDPADLWDASQIRDDNESDAIVYLSLFEPDDLVNINARYIIRKLQDGSQKAVLCGPGQTMLAAEWVELIHDTGTPQDRASAWVRINPLRTRRGNSPSGAHTDADVLSYVRLLLESDLLPYDIALALFAKIALPICAIIDSAGRGPHAIVSIGATDARDFASKAGEIITSLEPFGIDPGNSNPSRYSRLPGARRIIGARCGASIQKLLFVAPNPRLGGIF